MMEERAAVKKQNSKKEFEKYEHSWIKEGVFWSLDSAACLYLQLDGHTNLKTNHI